MGVKLWVNTYDLVQHFGGPEEGGWYYWEGTPERSEEAWCHCEDGEYINGAHTPHCPITHLLKNAKAVIAGFKPGYLGSYISGDAEEPEFRGEGVYGDKEIKVETHTGHTWPEERPYYE